MFEIIQICLPKDMGVDNKKRKIDCKAVRKTAILKGRMEGDNQAAVNKCEAP